MMLSELIFQFSRNYHKVPSSMARNAKRNDKSLKLIGNSANPISPIHLTLWQVSSLTNTKIH